MRACRARRTAVLAALLVAARVAPGAAQARDPHEAQPERPTVSTHAGTVATGWAEVEAGIEVDRADGASSGLVPIALKLGLAPRAQVTLLPSVVRPPGGPTRLGDVGVGVKVRVFERTPIGDLAIQPGVKLPTGSRGDGTGTGTTDGSLLVIVSRDVGPIDMDVNYSRTVRSGDGRDAPERASLWAVAAGGSVHGATGWTAEIFGLPATSGPSGAEATVGAMTAVTCALRPWAVLDAGVVWPVAGPQARAVVAGFVYNVGHVWGRR